MNRRIIIKIEKRMNLIKLKIKIKKKILKQNIILLLQLKKIILTKYKIKLENLEMKKSRIQKKKII